MLRNGGKLKLLHPVVRSNYAGDRLTLSGLWAGLSIDDILDSNYGNRVLTLYLSRRV